MRFSVWKWTALVVVPAVVLGIGLSRQGQARADRSASVATAALVGMGFSEQAQESFDAVRKKMEQAKAGIQVDFVSRLQPTVDVAGV